MILTPVKFRDLFSSSISIQMQKAISADSDEAAHYELPHLDLSCLQTQLHVYSFLALEVLGSGMNESIKQKALFEIFAKKINHMLLAYKYAYV